MHVWCESERTSFSIMFFLLKNLVVCSACVFFIHSIGSVTGIHWVVLPLPFSTLLVDFFPVSSSASHFDVWFHRSMLFALFIRYAVSFVILRALSLCYYCLLLLFDCLKNRLQFSSGDVLCCGRFVFLSFHHTIPCRGVTSCFQATAVFHFIYYVIIMIELTGEQRNE